MIHCIIKTLLYPFFVCFVVLPMTGTLAEDSYFRSEQICKPVSSQTSADGSICAEVLFKNRTMRLRDVRYVEPGQSFRSGAPIQFRKGTANELCTIFNGEPRPLNVEVRHADGVRVPGFSRSIAYGPIPPELTVYEEVTCLR